MFTTSSFLAVALATQPTVAPANEVAAAQGQETGPGRDHHSGDPSEIVVTGVRRDREDVLGGVSVLAGEDLAREVRPTIGETLAKQPGVSASSFGPNASRPIIRGLGGERIRLLTDGIGALDVSNSSADHAVAINPLTAERIEVLRGPSALLFGSSAIGGVVNVIDNRIPRSESERPLHFDLLGALGSASDERAINARVDVPIVSKLVFHADGSWVKTNDLEIGGHVLTQELREQARASSDPNIGSLANLKGDLPNSGAKQTEIAGGLAWVDGPLNIGFAISRLDNRYGVPVRYALEPGDEAEKVELDVRQYRYDARAEIPLGGLLDSVRLRGGVSDYRHVEIEETGEIASSFTSNGSEARAEFLQRTREGWGGAFGAQYLDKKVEIVGEEKFLPPNRTRQFGLFALQNYEAGLIRAEVGGRVEFSKVTAGADDDLGNPDLSRRFTAVSGSVGGTYGLGGGVRSGLNLSYTQRAPSADELYANGPHAGTQAFEIGNPAFGKERGLGIEALLRRSAGPFTFSGSLYHTRFKGFIYLAPTGEIEDDLPVFEYQQNNARFTGFEVETRVDAGTMGGIRWAFEGVADYVRAKIEGCGPAPQVPPLRVIGVVEGRRASIDARLEIERNFAQRRNAPVETETNGFTSVNASLNWRPIDDRPNLTLGVAANNIFDANQRRATSFLKDYAPLAGRDFRLTARIGF